MKRTIALILALILAAVCFGCVDGTANKGNGNDVAFQPESTGNPNTLYLLTPLTEFMVRYYYNLDSETKITQEMLNGITSLRVNLVIDMKAAADANQFSPDELEDIDEYTIDKYIIGFEVNYLNSDDPYNYCEKKSMAMFGGGARSVMSQPYSVMSKAYFENVVLTEMRKTLDENNFEYKKVRAYYLLKDEANVTSDRARDELLTAFPKVAGGYPIYLFDPTASGVEYIKIIGSLARYTDDFKLLILDEARLDAEEFDVFPNLKTLIGDGITID